MESEERLEQRVKTLEYEFKILKNEIQRALLDIQEQILVHYYPALRSEQPTPAPEVVQSLGAIQEKRGAKEALAPPVERPAGEPLPVKKVSLDDVRKAREEPPAAAEVRPSTARGPKTEPPNVMALTEWVNASAAKIGKERATKLLEMVSQKGYLAGDVKDLLVKVCVATASEGPVGKVATNDTLSALLKLNELLGRGTNVEEALSLIDEAKLG